VPIFEWHPDKQTQKSTVTFEDAIHVFDDDRAIDEVDPDPDEDRRRIIGIRGRRILVVVYTEPDEDRI